MYFLLCNVRVCVCVCVYPLTFVHTLLSMCSFCKFRQMIGKIESYYYYSFVLISGIWWPRVFPVSNVCCTSHAAVQLSIFFVDLFMCSVYVQQNCDLNHQIIDQS